MAGKIICLDTSILIDYFRKKNKRKTFFFKLAREYSFAISVITKFEILNGSNEDQKEFWDQLFSRFRIIPLDESEVEVASEIIKKLRSRNKLIELPDILIAATSLTHGLKLATLNKAHFQRIEDLSLILNV
jgi:predicted nucleic acid-binding protein